MPGIAVTDFPLIAWTDLHGAEHTAVWRTEGAAPRRAVPADDQISADAAYRLVCEGTALVWQGDFQNARQLAQALARRIDRKPRKAPNDPVEAFHRFRMAQAQRARTLALLLIPVEADYSVALRRAPDFREACEAAWGPSRGARLLVPLRELLGVVGSWEWRKKGVPLEALGGASIHPHYGVFSPVRGEYLTLVARAPLPARTLAFDIGTGTGVLAAILAGRGVERVVATDLQARALACAADNLARLGLNERVALERADLFPEGRAPLVVCNPPWLPGKPSSALEAAVYDAGSAMLKGFLSGLPDHLEAGGEGWLILSDLAEHLGLRTRDELLGWIDAAGLAVIARDDIRPVHPKAQDRDDPLHQARAAEVTSLWRLAVKHG